MREQRLNRSPLISNLITTVVVWFVSLALVLIMALLFGKSLSQTSLLNALLADTVVAMFALIALYWRASRLAFATVPTRVQGGLEVSVQAVKGVTASSDRPGGGRKLFGLSIGWVVVLGIAFGIIVPFIFLPALHLAVALPVISVPGEHVNGTPFTNTQIGVFIGDILAIAFVFAAGYRSRLKQVPGRLQSMLELIVELFDGQARQMVGPKARSILPLALTIFVFLLFTNWVELIPGVDSIGTMQCTEASKSGYPVLNGVFLDSPKPLNSGTIATSEDAAACATLASGGQLTGDQPQRAALTAKLDAGTLTNADLVAAKYAPMSVNKDGFVTTDTSAAVTPVAPATTAASSAAVPAAPVSTGTTFVPLHPNLHVVSSFVRAGATDLSLTVMLAIVAFLVTEFYGIREFGARYFFKFFNVPAARKVVKAGVPVGQRAFAGIDIFVGLLEGVSELARLLSYSFRLFGNLFAGQALIFVLSFLIGALVPVVIYLLEMFVGFIQATVFALLLLMFTGLALTGAHSAEEEAEIETAHAEAASHS